MQKIFNVVVFLFSIIALYLSIINYSEKRENEESNAPSGVLSDLYSLAEADSTTLSKAPLFHQLSDSVFSSKGFETRVAIWKTIFTLDSSLSIIFDKNSLNIIDIMPNILADERRSHYDSLSAETGHRLITLKGMRQKICKGIENSTGFYFLHDTLKFYGLPDRLFWLPLLESNFDDNAVSKANAVGAFQFVKWTARYNKLKVNQYIDDRRNRYKASGAFARHLKKLFNKFHLKEIAVTAYNRGGNAHDIKHDSNDNSSEIINQLGFAPSNYYAEFLAISDIAENPKAYLLPLKKQPKALKPKKFVNNEPIKPSALLQKLNITQEEIRQLNPWLKKSLFTRNRTLPRKLSFIIPGYLDNEGSKALEKTESDTLLKADSTITYKVKRGDSVDKIAKRFHGSSRKGIIADNKLNRPNDIQIGQTLIIRIEN